MGFHEDAAGADGIDEEGVWSVEGVDEAAALAFGPACGLDGAGGFDGEFVEVIFPFVVRDAAFEHEAAEVSVGGEVVEAVVVDADVGDVGGHVADGVVASAFEAFLVVGCIEVEDGDAVAEAFGPLGPAAGGVFAGDGEDG